MTLRSSLLATVARIRSIPQTLGLRNTTVTVVVETWSAAVGTSGATLSSTVSTVLTPTPRVTAQGDGGASAFGGGYASQSAGGLVATEYEIGPVTPDHTSGGYSWSDLIPTGDVTKEVYVVLAGENFTGSGERFEVVPGSLVGASFRYTFRVRRVNQ